jgi:uncharacterized protein YbaR (Trm112 family)
MGAMRKELMEILVCPMCKGELALHEAAEGGDEDEIVTGELRCTSCGEVYPIEDGIPNMLPPDMRQ